MIAIAMRLRAIGFWRSVKDERPTLPDPRDFVDPDWDARERETVVDYLRAGRRVRPQMGSSRCRLCGSSSGSAEQTDGTYLWPEGYAHYVSEHAVRPPREFVEHVQRELHQMDAMAIDRDWWSAQSGNATARHWLRWKLEIGPCDLRATSIIQQLAGNLLGWDRAERIYSELSRRGTARLTLTDRALAEQMRERLSGAQVPCTVLEERVPVPETLLG